MATTTTIRTGTYQMLWDCPSCGTCKLLGVDHRHCPNCGAPQEENLRYFPSKEDRVATDFRGSDPDWECNHCGTPTGSEASYCGGCGAPRGDSETVFVRSSIPSDQGETGEQAAAEWNQRQGRAPAPRAGVDDDDDELTKLLSRWPKLARLVAGLRRRPKRLIWLGLGVALLAVLLLAVCDRKVHMQVYAHSWARVIPVERYQTISESAWCSSTPSDARIHSRVSEIHHYNQVPDGEDCRTVPETCSMSCSNVDNGNGSFSEVCSQTCSSGGTECTTRYRDEPVYADKCYYEVDRWIVVRSARTTATDLSPVWPDEPSYSGCAGVQIGCERLGARYGTYVLHYSSLDRGDELEKFECAWPEPVWRATAVGTRFIGQVSRLTGNLDCEELEPAHER
jgi:hypothetical protein